MQGKLCTCRMYQTLEGKNGAFIPIGTASVYGGRLMPEKRFEGPIDQVKKASFPRETREGSFCYS